MLTNTAQSKQVIAFCRNDTICQCLWISNRAWKRSKFCIFKKYQTLVLRATFGGWIVIIKYWQEGSKLRGRGMVQHVLEIVVRLVRCCYQLKKGIPRSSSLSRCNHFQTLHTALKFVLKFIWSLTASEMFFEGKKRVTDRQTLTSTCHKKCEKQSTMCCFLARLFIIGHLIILKNCIKLSVVWLSDKKHVPCPLTFFHESRTLRFSLTLYHLVKLTGCFVCDYKWLWHKNSAYFTLCW